MLSALVFFLLFIIKIPLVMAQDHQAWTLQQQKQSQALIRQYEKEALELKSNTPFSFQTKGCLLRDYSNCAKRKGPEQQAKTRQENFKSEIYIFASFSMPKESLKALAMEAKKHNALLVIRGLIENSFLKTASFLKDFGEGVVLDPLLFREYNVVVVPTFIEKHPAGYKKISGNITLAYALSKFERCIE